MREQLLEIVGDDNFFDSPELLEAFAQDYSLAPKGRPNYVVRVKAAHEIQRIIRLANETKTPVVPSSSGIHFQGVTIPKQGGIVLDLSSMNGILDIDARNRWVRIEAGVTWEKIEAELEKWDSRVVIPLLPHASRSVVTDYLEDVPPLIPMDEYGAPIGGTEVVWPNGDIFRTGSASVPGYPNTPSRGANFEGPGINFIILIHGAQGTMGVVTWANVKTEYLPKLNETFFGQFDNLEEAVEVVYGIQRLRIGKECLLLNRLNLAMILAEVWPQDFEALRRELSPWVLILTLSGARRRPEEKIAYEEKALMKLMKEQFPSITLSQALPPAGGAEKKLSKMLQKPWPSDLTYWKHRYKDRSQDLFFITKPTLASRFASKVDEVANRYGYPLSDIGGYVQPIEYSRACHLEFNFYYNHADPREVERVRRLYAELARVMLDMGAFYRRPYGLLSSLVYGRASNYTATLKRVKKLFDPNNIMNPGNLCF